MRKVVTTYVNPDMDGISLMYAYAEFLKKRAKMPNIILKEQRRKKLKLY